MKKLLTLIFIFCAIASITLKASSETMKFQEAFDQSGTKPMLILVYAQWADGYQNYIKQFRTVQNEFGDTFNYVEMDIADKDTKNFNNIYHIYPNLPYILMFRNGGKISRYLPRDCAADSACMITKIKTFLR